ncbi:hypothetical protein SSX86_003848 [Deinandra increscens subsp. villosa]|uniref:SAWADEE domain-containing protein n=1 Tax=Deinandra increscens subsp. villosa TaxID=3103831 RepID=A0AAP0H752_9ASTR
MANFNGVDFNLEYRSRDDAWYTCGVVLEDGKQLRVKFQDFIESHFDEVFSIADLSTHHEIEQLIRKFRPVSVPLEDNECSKVIEGMKVCAIYRRGEEVLYFDAIVDDVHYIEHTPEKCLCTYLLFWQNGPGKGNITATTLEDICLIMDGAIHPKVSDFVNFAKQKLKISSNEKSDKSQESGNVGHSSRGRFSAGRERSFPELSDQDRDLGGVNQTDHHHYVMLENLEIDLCPLLMMDFIQEHTSIAAQAFVFPSLLAETYARGAIMVDSITKLRRIYDFINNPNHFITSFSGRPWVIAEDKLRSGTLNINLQSFQPKHENYSTNRELKVVRSGTEEYRKSKQLKDLYLELRNHIKGLVQRFSMEEQNRDPYGFCKL